MGCEVEVTIKGQCEDCGKETNNVDEFYLHCTNCHNKLDIKDFQEALKSTMKNHTYLWTDKDGYGGFKDDKEKEMFMTGVKKGFIDALFWMADELGQVDFFETLGVQDKLNDEA